MQLLTRDTDYLFFSLEKIDRVKSIFGFYWKVLLTQRSVVIISFVFIIPLKLKDTSQCSSDWAVLLGIIPTVVLCWIRGLSFII